MSRPLMFAFIKTSPSHRTRLKVRANARPLNANEAIRGSPSPWNVLIMMPTQATESVKRLQASAPDRVAVMTVQKSTIVWFPQKTRSSVHVDQYKRDSRG